MAYTRTFAVYSPLRFTDADLDASSRCAAVNDLRKHVRAFTQRVGSAYLVEANILGFAGESTGLEEQCVLSSAVKWALADYSTRFGAPPRQIIMHLDVNGTLALGDVAGSKKFGKIAASLAANALKRSDEDNLKLGSAERLAMVRAVQLPEEQLQLEYSVNYSVRARAYLSGGVTCARCVTRVCARACACVHVRALPCARQGNDFVRALLTCLGALAPAAIRELDSELAGMFNGFSSKATQRHFELAAASDSLEKPALTVAIRTNGVEHRQAAGYVQRLVMGTLGLEISEGRDTLRRYVVTVCVCAWMRVDACACVV